MPTFNYVEVWPPTGWPDKLWSNVGDADEDAFARSARSITELYTESLAELKIPGHRSMLRLSRLGPSDDVSVVVFLSVQRSVNFEMARLLIPVGVADWSPSIRALTVLDVVHETVLRLADARGMDKSPFAVPYAHVIDSGLQYRWDSPWKTSPDRRHQARAQFRLMEDGYGRVRIEVRERRGAAVVAATDEAVAFSTSKGFQRSARTLRWTDNDAVQLVPYIGLGAEASNGLVRLEHVGTSWVGFVEDAVNLRRPGQVRSDEAVGAPSARPQVRFQ